MLAVASGAAFLAMLDATVANLAVADLHTDFPDVAVADLSWVITIYAITFAALLAPGGRFADLVGRRALLTFGAALFTIMSISAAAAPSLGFLLAARGLQGVGAAAMIPASLGVVLADTPPERRAAAIGAWSAAGAFAAAAGPSLGGVLVDVFGWRSVFFITIPAGLAVLAGTQVLPMAGARAGGRPQTPDYLGIALLAAGIGVLALGVSRASVWGWGDARTLAAIAGGLAGVAIVLARSRRHSAPAVEVGLWRSRTFALANLASLMYGAVLFSWLLCGVLFLTQVWGYSPLKAGLAVSPGAIVAAVVALRAGPVVARYGPRPVVVGGLAITAAIAVWLIFGIDDTPAFLTLWLPISFPLGIGMGAITTGLSAAAALAVQPAQFAAGVGLNQAARAVGGALGVAALATILQGTDPSAAASYVGVYEMCTILLVAAIVVALGLKGAER
ncbi:MFS transporter [Baekduia alba]|uniref:MFS transporter n=1 Tax=Baekduia alba TaxID=2997333 RepID=UPI00234238C2|nr:MFS transporter [Baekduia alba]